MFAVRYVVLTHENGRTRARWTFLRSAADQSRAAIYRDIRLASRAAYDFGGEVISLEDENVCLLLPVL